MISEMLTYDKISTNVECKSWREVVKAAGDLLVKAGDIEDEFIGSMIGVVEEFGPYMILAPEVAFFHGRPSEAVHKICLSLVTLKEPVVFEEYGGETIKCAFAFGAVDHDSHIEMLKEMADLLQNDEFLDLVRGNGDKAEILRIIKKISG
jgi:mannitol/fructose-specific phosphotransferase system IIA component (Ntr-type)